jgi:fatty acid synthase subunit alpha, fungi type
VFPITSLEPRIVQDTITGDEGQPTPMLLVIGLALQDIERHVKETNTHLPSNAKLFVSLYNGPRAFVVNGPPHSLYGLVTNLGKIRTPNGVDQSKIPASQLKAVFSVRFLVIGVPFHNSEYLESVGEKVVADLGEELWKKDDLAIPVYHTEDGRFSFYTSSFSC